MHVNYPRLFEKGTCDNIGVIHVYAAWYNDCFIYESMLLVGDVGVFASMANDIDLGQSKHWQEFTDWFLLMVYMQIA